MCSCFFRVNLHIYYTMLLSDAFSKLFKIVALKSDYEKSLVMLFTYYNQDKGKSAVHLRNTKRNKRNLDYFIFSPFSLFQAISVEPNF